MSQLARMMIYVHRCISSQFIFSWENVFPLQDRAVGVGGSGGQLPPLPIFIDKLTLSQPRGQITPITLLLPPPHPFFDFPTALQDQTTNWRTRLKFDSVATALHVIFFWKKFQSFHPELLLFLLHYHNLEDSKA